MPAEMTNILIRSVFFAVKIAEAHLASGTIQGGEMEDPLLLAACI